MESFLDLIKRLSDGKPGLNFSDYIQQALYHPQLGYYRRQGVERVGHTAAADFYTAESLGPVFGSLVVAAAVSLMGPGEAKEMAFVEIGAEGESPVLAEVGCFREMRAIRLGGDLILPPRSLVFCNELLDAQPFHRLIFKEGKWQERGVAVAGGKLVEVLLPELSRPVAAMEHDLPSQAAEGYQLDLPLGAEQLLAELAAQPHLESVIAFDYGLDWNDIACCRPAGTARTYSRQQLGGDLLDQPGQIDITCHICWDRLEAILRRAGFVDVRLQRQESFFMNHSMEAIQTIIRGGDIKQQSTLRELLHPSRLGSAFQVLTARR